MRAHVCVCVCIGDINNKSREQNGGCCWKPYRSEQVDQGLCEQWYRTAGREKSSNSVSLIAGLALDTEKCWVMLFSVHMHSKHAGRWDANVHESKIEGFDALRWQPCVSTLGSLEEHAHALTSRRAAMQMPRCSEAWKRKNPLRDVSLTLHWLTCHARTVPSEY